ncbi:cytochrome P450 [Kitasatospora sp. NPDC006697]|uniref:cytochrome P450 n=1 Tax=Kitasatospora sp. NPDC006697 TaxID=3364020 RepID=UPI00367B52C5
MGVDSGLPAEIRGLFDWLDGMRATEPVHLDERTGSWHVFGYREVSRVYADPGLFSSDLGALMPSQPELELFAKGNFVRMDPPRQQELRRLVSRAFTSRTVAELAPRITEITDELLDAVGDRTELVEALTYPLPIVVIAELLGVPAGDRELFRGWADVMLSGTMRADEVVVGEETLRSYAPTMLAMFDYFTAQVRDRRARPGDDLISALVAAELDGQRLDDDEIAGFAIVLLVAGHVTTTAVLGTAVLLLDEHPEVAAALRADRSAVPAAIEEVLRCRPPFTRNLRRTTRAAELGGRTIPADTAVSVWLAAANRDPAQFPDPLAFDLRRSPNPHLSFGHGIHFCLGAPLARLESRIALERLFDRFAELRVDREQGVEYFPSAAMLFGARRLPVLLA